MRLNHLGNALHKRYQSEGDPADLDESIAVLTRAVAETAYGEPEHASYLQNLGLTQLTRARATEDEALLNRAVATLGRAVYASPPAPPVPPAISSRTPPRSARCTRRTETPVSSARPRTRTGRSP